MILWVLTAAGTRQDRNLWEKVAILKLMLDFFLNHCSLSLMCVPVYLCVVYFSVHMNIWWMFEYVYLCMWRLEIDVQCLPQSLSSFLFWGRVFHRTSSSSAQLGCSANELQRSACLSLPSSGVQMYAVFPLIFNVEARNLFYVLMLSEVSILLANLSP